MKKAILLFATAMLTMGVSAQTVYEESKTFDNVYIGVNGGLSTKTTGHAWMSGLNSNAGIRVGKWFSPVFGEAIEGNVYFSNKAWAPKSTGTFVRYSNISIIGTVNFTNWFGGYNGEPRCFEVVGVGGFGWGHGYGVGKSVLEGREQLTSKVGVDFTFNLGREKAWQFYVEPSLNYVLIGGTLPVTADDELQYNINRSAVQLNAGIIYKFRNSNGTHHFKTYNIGEMMNEINQLKAELARKPKEVVKEVPAPQPTTTVKEVKVESMLFVNFAQGKSTLTDEAKATLNKLKEGVHVQIVGTASPEGNAKFNQRLSQERANVVAEYLKTKGVIVDEAVGKGVQGNTSNRMAVVYVK